MKRLKKLLPVMLLALLAWNCQKEEASIPQENIMETASRSAIQKIDYRQLPLHIRDEVSHSVGAARGKGRTGKGGEPFGDVRQDRVDVMETDDGTTSYTLGMEKLAEGAYMDRLVVTEDVDGRLSTHILRYRPSGDWLARRASGETGWEAYTGDIAIFDGEGDPKAAGHFNGGQVTAQATGKGTAGKSDEMDCTITDMTLAGLEQDGVFYVTDIIIEYECSGSGTNDGDDDPDLDNGGGEFPQDQGPQGGGGGGNGEQIPTIIDDELVLEDKIINNLSNPCAKSIFTELENGIFENDILKPEVQIVTNNIFTLNFSETILKLFEDSTQTNYTILNGNVEGSNASTNPLNNTTTLSNAYLANATQLSIARTMIHELLHAYINSTLKNRPGFINMTLGMKMREYAKDRGIIEAGVFHHEFMAQYVDAMAYSLYEWDKQYGTGGNLGWDYYNSMAWGGLFQTDGSGSIVSETDSFKELVPNSNDRQDIADIVFNEIKGKSDAKGTKCD
jgi:hypothetical protein